MKRAWILVLLTLIMLCVVGIEVARRGLGPTHQSDLTQPRIYAYRDWQSVGVQVNQGDLIRLRAQGRWMYTPGEYHGPEGHRVHRAPNFYPMSGPAGGALLGRVDEDGQMFVVGRGGTFYAERPGLLYLRINDDILSDNEGYVTVEVSVTSPTSR
jgi:hypothetical protein